MKKSIPVVDNVTDILNVIMQFTQMRRKVLTKNIQEATNPHFEAKDLPAAAFSVVLEEALDELSNHQRVIWRDLHFMSFKSDGQIQFQALSDPKANHLKTSDNEAYLEYQTKRIMENEINQKMVTNLLTRHQSSPAIITV